MLPPFHLAIPVSDLALTRNFYHKVLGCEEGRTDTHWVDFNFFGHQLVLHQKEGLKKESVSNPVDGKEVPVPHFGVVLSIDDWNALAERLKSQHIKFIIEPYIRFEGEVGEQRTMFFQDPEGNALEFKAFADISGLFAKD
ncbi:VOC family protein [Cryomorphaceae bacterium 1068]|nr:VOC family protein [Cryomorphaceae bacterium 1068]